MKFFSKKDVQEEPVIEKTQNTNQEELLKEYEEEVEDSYYKDNGDGTVTILYMNKWSSGSIEEMVLKKEDIICIDDNKFRYLEHEEAKLYYLINHKLRKQVLFNYEITQDIVNNNLYLEFIKRFSCEIEETELDITIQEVFEKQKPYCLIETLEELNNYLDSDLTYEEWQRKKIITKMLELNLGVGFINAFAHKCVDFKDYNTLTRLANECENRDILMYLLVKYFDDETRSFAPMIITN